MNICRKWVLPNKYTFQMTPVRNLLLKYGVGTGWVDPFCGQSELAEFRGDLSRGQDAHDFLKQFASGSISGALFDPPYSMEQVKRSYNSVGVSDWQKIGNNKNGGFPKVKDEIARILKPKGVCISFGWNSNGMGKKRNFEILEVVLLAHGGNRHDTIITVERKK